MIKSVLALITGMVAAAALAADSGAPTPAPAAASRYTFSWPVGPGAPAPRGGTTRGAPTEVDRDPSREWQSLQAPGLSAHERDRRAILAMAGGYRVTFDFLEIATFTGNGDRPVPTSRGARRRSTSMSTSRATSASSTSSTCASWVTTARSAIPW